MARRDHPRFHASLDREVNPVARTPLGEGGHWLTFVYCLPWTPVQGQLRLLRRPEAAASQARSHGAPDILDGPSLPLEQPPGCLLASPLEVDGSGKRLGACAVESLEPGGSHEGRQHNHDDER
jgi:hypothetical protein